MGRDALLGDFLYTTREGAEHDLVEELGLSHLEAHVAAPALVTSRRPPPEGKPEPTFARQGFPIQARVAAPTPAALAEQLAAALAPTARGAATYALHVWVPDSTAANPLGSSARELRELVEAALRAEAPAAAEVDARELPASAPLLQICLARADLAFAGASPAGRALSLAPGGRLRAHVGGDRPSRSARKLAEALAWLGVGPEPGELCVDLGAAPGGWTWLLLERRARVIAVDPGKLRPDLMSRRGLRYVPGSAFDFTPEEPADWLFCDMAWRPLEVAKMLCRWAKNHDTTLLVANFKLPMKRKAAMVAELRATLERGGYRSVRARQLYHDRDEITVTARAG